MPVEGLHGAICIYVDGRAQFMDELELLSDAEQDRVLDVYCNELGLNQICIGPAYALPYDHHDLPPIDWRVYDIFPLLRKFRARGLHITIVMMPDGLPYFDGRRWNRQAFVNDLLAIYIRIAEAGLADSVRLEWEIVAPNDDYCWATTVARDVFGPDLPVYFHTPVGHLSPGTSDEDERSCWLNALAVGLSGADLQCATLYQRPDALSAMKYDLWDLRRRAAGTDGSPWGGPMLTLKGVPFTVRNAEYAAYSILHSQMPWDTACYFGQQGTAVPGPGDDTALDGWKP